ncbi:MAG: hypothetical protein U1E93_09165 [Alphaproteobacteria bacterium]
MYAADWQDFDSLRSQVLDGLRAGARVVQPFIFQAVSESPADSGLLALSGAATVTLAKPAAPFDMAALQAVTRKSASVTCRANFASRPTPSDGGRL